MGKITVKLKNLVKEHFYLFILLLLSIFFFHNIISSTRIMDNIHYINDVTFYSYNMKESLKNGNLPLWTPYYYSGRPLFAQPEYYFIDINLFLIMLIGNIYLAMNLSVIFHLFIAGLGMYFLALFLCQNKHAAFISALAYMFNGYVHTFAVPGNIMILEGYSLVTFIFLFTIKALKDKNFVFNSVIAGIFVALQIFVGGVIYIPYIFLLIAVYSIIYIANKSFLNKILKLAIVGILISAVGLSLSAIKLLPGIEFMNLSNRGTGIPYQEFIGAPIQLKNFIFTFVTNTLIQGDNISAAIGIAGFMLLIFGLYRFKDKIVVFSALIILISLIMSSESFITKILFNIPILNQTRHIERSIFLFAFAASILAGIGFLNLQSLLEKYNKIKLKNAIFIIVIFLIFFELFILQKMPQSVNVMNPKDIPILEYMSRDTSTFRTVNLALSTLIGASGYNYYSQFGISEIKGGSGIWFNEYLTYLIVAQNAPAKFWGILNDKYVIMHQNASIDGLKYIGKFGDCKECPIWEAAGPYLYENAKYLPRYYVVPNAILVAGDESSVQQLIYGLMLQNFEPKNTVIVEGTKVNDYDLDFLKKFSVIFLTKGSVDQDSVSKLKDYASKGGLIFPDILNGKNSISNEDVTSIFNKTFGSYKEIKIDEYTNNKIVLELNGEKGWLVVSERFAYFPGWSAKINGRNIDIFKADNAVSAVYLNGENGKLTFEYKPNSYKTGKLISLIAIVVIVIYFGYFVYRKKLKPGDSNQA